MCHEVANLDMIFYNFKVCAIFKHMTTKTTVCKKKEEKFITLLWYSYIMKKFKVCSAKQMTGVGLNSCFIGLSILFCGSL